MDMSHIRDPHTPAARRLFQTRPCSLNLTVTSAALHIRSSGPILPVRTVPWHVFPSEKRIGFLLPFFKCWCHLLKAVLFTIVLISTQILVLQLRITRINLVLGVALPKPDSTGAHLLIQDTLPSLVQAQNASTNNLFHSVAFFSICCKFEQL